MPHGRSCDDCDAQPHDGGNGGPLLGCLLLLSHVLVLNEPSQSLGG